MSLTAATVTATRVRHALLMVEGAGQPGQVRANIGRLFHALLRERAAPGQTRSRSG